VSAETIRPVDLTSVEIPIDILKTISYETMKRWCVLPFALINNKLSVAAANPRDVTLSDHLRLLTGYEVEMFSSSREEVVKALKNYFEILLEVGTVKELAVKEGESNLDAAAIVQRLFEVAVDFGASDIHLEPQTDGFFVRFRIDGILKTMHTFPKTAAAPLTSRIKVLSGLDITERRLLQDGQISARIRKNHVDLRVSTLPGKYGEKVVVRVLYKATSTLGLERMGLDPTSQGLLEMLIERPLGIFLVTGPTGSGKTTTLYSILHRLKSPLKNIITLEDPVEYEILATSENEAGVTQVQMNSKIGLTFASTLRASLRQDPDILMVGEIRDKETAEIAMRSAMTGHLVLSTLHTNSASETITRLRDIGIEPYLMTSTILGILAQRLVRVLCHYCKLAYSPPRRALKGIIGEDAQGEVTLYKAKGCPQCQRTGYKGRTGVFELLEMNDELRVAILSNKNINDLKEIVRRQGIKTLREGGMALVLKGLTTVEEVFRVTAE